jgi:hypothetical protein
MESMCYWTGAALALWQNHAALAALRGWMQAAQQQRHTGTALLRCIAKLHARVRMSAQPGIISLTTSPPACVKLAAIVRPAVRA